jgi:hypothetical protein
MSRPPLYRVRLLRACRIGDRLHLAGAKLDLPPAEAFDLVRDRRAVLQDHADLALLVDAIRANAADRWTRPHAR